MKHQRGAALIMVMLAVALISIVAVELSGQVSYHTSRLTQARGFDQGYWYARGGEQLALSFLEDAVKEKRIHLGQDWATPDAVFPLDHGVMQGNVKDLHSCFNLNGLRHQPLDQNQEPGEDQRQVFERLLSFAEVDAGQAAILMDRVADWIDSDLQPGGIHGAEDLEFSNAKPAYQPPNQAMVDASELRLAAPESGEIIDKISQWLCALPATDTRININTVAIDDVILMAAYLNASVADAASLLESRPADGWQSVEEMLALPLMDAYKEKVNSAMLDINSRYFETNIDVRYRDSGLRLRSLLASDGNGIVVFAREYGDLL